jgi:hypothetical protein
MAEDKYLQSCDCHEMESLGTANESCDLALRMGDNGELWLSSWSSSERVLDLEA